MTSHSESVDTANIESEKYKLAFLVGVSVRYHWRRQAFFETFERFSNALSIVLGSTTIYGVIEQKYNTFALIFSGFCTLVSTINMVLNSSQKAREHSDFAKKFIKLEKKIELSKDITLQEVSALKAEKLTIEINEPPVKHVLNAICHNEQLRAMGYSKLHFIKIKWYQRWCANFVDINESSLENPSQSGSEGSTD